MLKPIIKLTLGLLILTLFSCEKEEVMVICEPEPVESPHELLQSPDGLHQNSEQDQIDETL
jgi:hypothetical protein